MKEVKNILFIGVGGQGTILASKILSEGLLRNGYDVKMSEVHGMAQRGGVNEALRSTAENTVIIKAAEVAKDLGNMKAQNVVLLGALLKALDIKEVNWEEVVASLVPAKAVELNKKALVAGMEV